MSIHLTGHNYYRSSTTEVKRAEHVSGTEKAGCAQELSEAEEMAAFKKEFYAELERIPKNGTIVNLAINISEEAFENMKADPEYREQILSVLRRDLTSSFAPMKASLLITVGATAEDYRGDSWSGVNNDSEFYARSRNSFYKKTNGKVDRHREALEEYLEKWAQAKKQQQEILDEKMEKAEQERNRLAKARMRERQMAGYSDATVKEDAAAVSVSDRDEVIISREGRNNFESMAGKIDDQLRTMTDENFKTMYQQWKNENQIELEVAPYRKADPDGSIARKTYFESYLGQLRDMENTIRSYYADAYEEAVSAPIDSLAFISAKYLVSWSDYYEPGIPVKERQWMHHQLRAMLTDSNVALNDPYALASCGGPKTVEEMDKIAKQAVKDKLDALLSAEVK